MDINWIKLDVKLFDNKKIKKIRRMPDGEKMLIIWIYLLTAAGKCNAGGMICISETVPLDYDDISDDININIQTVELAIDTFRRLDMIIIDAKKFIYISDWENHQNIEGMEKAKLLRKERNKRYYEKKQHLIENKTSSKTLKDGVDKTRLDKDKNMKIANSIIDYLNDKANKKYKHIESNRTHIISRLNDGYTFDDCKSVITCKVKDPYFIQHNQYLNCETLFRPKNFEKYINSIQPIQEPKNIDYKMENYPDEFDQ